MTHDYLAESGGAFDWSGESPAQMLIELRTLGDGRIEPVTFVAHPRDGILGYFDQMGFRPYGGEVADPRVEDGLLKITNPLTNSENFTLNFDALELMNGKRYDFLRTPTQPELDAYAADQSTTAQEIIERTLAEQDDLNDGVYQLGYGMHGQIDDWFALLNMGFQITVPISFRGTEQRYNNRSGATKESENRVLNATHLCYLDFVPHSPFGLAPVGVSAPTDRKTGVLSVLFRKVANPNNYVVGCVWYLR